MKTNKSQHLANFALKLDMSKSYDRVDWCFLNKVMMRMGFCGVFVENIMRCISSVSYFILINGRPLSPLFPSRGLRQGDPLSPYLFLLCAEAFSDMFRKAEMRGLIHGAFICRSAPPISHIFFADDSLIFGRASQEEVGAICNIIEKFTSASGQRVNFEKSEIAFSRCIPKTHASLLGNECGIPVVAQHSFYLGLTASIGR